MYQDLRELLSTSAKFVLPLTLEDSMDRIAGSSPLTLTNCSSSSMATMVATSTMVTTTNSS